MKRVFLTATLALISMLGLQLYSQVAINTDGSNPDGNAMLDVKSSDKGLLIPRIALTGTLDVTTIASPVTSLLIYNTATAGTSPNNVTPGYYYWNGSTWARLSVFAGGSGTNNMVTKWTSSGTLGNSLLFDNGSKVGIGTSDPKSGLNVANGGMAIGSGAGISITDGTKRSLQVLTDTYYGGTYDNHSGFLIYSTLPGGWGNSTLNFAVSTDWGEYNTAVPTLTIAGYRVGIGTTNPAASAALDVSATTKGMLTPRMTKTQRDAIGSPATGLVMYQTDNTPGFYYYSGTNWVSLTGSGPGGNSPSMCIDYDGNAYSTFTIGTQTWMLENLRVTHYRNGDYIPNVAENTEWAALSTGAYCWYNNNQAANAKYGAMYNWYAVNDSRGLCPQGWHVPTHAEWTALISYLGGTNVAGGKMKSVSSLWTSPNTDATNNSGFSGLPGGFRSNSGNFYNIGIEGNWWFSTEYLTGAAWFCKLNYDLGSIFLSNYFNKGGFSVRCLRD